MYTQITRIFWDETLKRLKCMWIFESKEERIFTFKKKDNRQKKQKKKTRNFKNFHKQRYQSLFSARIRDKWKQSNKKKLPMWPN